MIERFFVTGDIHGNVTELADRIEKAGLTSKDAVIILGDAGFNFYLNKTDSRKKEIVNTLGPVVYCVRGNHEERPENITTMHRVYDINIDGLVWCENGFRNIRYLMDGHDYKINGHSALVLGGAYSVDKEYRLSQKQKDGWCGWFENEQLSEKECTEIFNKVNGGHYDFILSHTCPYSWRPTDLFLSFIDQSTVDNSMEFWLEDIKANVDFDVWLWGHFHNDRVEAPRGELYYKVIEDMETVWERWHGDKNNTLLWMRKGPKYHDYNTSNDVQL